MNKDFQMISSRSSQMVLFAVIFCSIMSLQAARAEDHPWADFVVLQPEAQVRDRQEALNVIAPARQTPTLRKTVTGLPEKNSFIASSNLSLHAQHKTALPQTRLDGFIRTSGNKIEVYGKDGDLENTNYSPIESGFDGATREGLSTGHNSQLPGIRSLRLLQIIDGEGRL